MTEVKIPNHIMRLKSALLGCRYALDGESLYSVKWYKDGHEIYRYVPRDKPPGQAFPLPGVNIDVSIASTCCSPNQKTKKKKTRFKLLFGSRAKFSITAES